MPAAPYLTPAELRERSTHLAGQAGEDDALLERIVAEFEAIAEGYRGVAFTDRGQGEDDYPGLVYETPPETILRACAEYVTHVVTSQRSGTSRDVIAQSIEGTWTRYGTPDWSAGRPTGWNEVDRLLNSLPDYRCPGVA